MSDLNTLIKEFGELGKKIETSYVTKGQLEAYADRLAQISEKMDKQVEPSYFYSRVFKRHEDALSFVKSMQRACADAQIRLAPMESGRNSPFQLSKADLNSTTGTGGDTLQHVVASTFSYLLKQGAVNRRIATVIGDLHGSIDLTKRNGTSTAAFTSASSAAADDAAVSPGAFGTAHITLTPAQISALSLVSNKLLYASAINVAEMVAIDLIEQAGILEDVSFISGPGDYSSGGCTGITQLATGTSAQVGEVQIHQGLFATSGLDAILSMPETVHESVYASPNAKYYMAGATLSRLRALKAQTSGIFHLNPTMGKKWELGGYEIEIWHRVDHNFVDLGTAGRELDTNQFPVLFGDFYKASVVGIGRDMQLEVDRSVKFTTNQTAFRLTYDWTAGFLQPSAVSRLKVI